MTVIIRPSGGRWAGVDYVGGSTQTLSAAVELAMVNGGFATWAAGSGEDRLVPAQVRLPPAGAAAVEDPKNPGGALGGAGSVAVQALGADRALTAADNRVNLTVAVNRAVTLPAGLGEGFSAQFTNNSNTADTITVTPTGGATVNGGTAAVTRTLQPWQTTALIPVGVNAYAFPGA